MRRDSPFLAALSCWPFCLHKEKDQAGGNVTVPMALATPSISAPASPSSHQVVPADLQICKLTLGVCTPFLFLGSLLRVVPNPSFVPSRDFSERLIPVGCSLPKLQVLSGHKGKEQPSSSSSHRPPPQYCLVTKEPLIPSSGEGDSTVPSHATQDLSPSKSHLEIMNPPGLRGFQAL